MRRRGAGVVPPERLLRLRVDDWHDPGPEPSWRVGSDLEEWRLAEARREWHLARMAWLREAGRTARMVDALFGTGYDPATDDPRAPGRERKRIERVMLPVDEWTEAARHGAPA